jgi:plastocyanin|tara:strand:- start:921 stop:1613 length:693 start_codon:yes stop_codon:yes gene_type:complete
MKKKEGSVKIALKKEGKGHIAKKKHHTAERHSYRGLVIILVALIFIGLIVLPQLFQEEQVEDYEPAPIVEPIKPSPPPEHADAPVDVFVEEEIKEPVKKTEPSEKRISIKRHSLEPSDIKIEERTIVNWVNEDTRLHKIVCYINSRRIFVGDRLNNGDVSAYNFKDAGEYLCLDAVFGSRMTVTVKPTSLFKITGGTVRALPTENIVLTGLLAFVLLFTIAIYMYANKMI